VPAVIVSVIVYAVVDAKVYSPWLFLLPAVGSEACRLSSFKRMTMTGHRQRNSRKKTWPTQPGRSQAINWHSGTGKKDERRKDGQKPRADCDLS